MRNNSVTIRKRYYLTSNANLIDMWFSDDENRILVCFETKVRWGAIDGRLCSYENLNHPFSSLIQ